MLSNMKRILQILLQCVKSSRSIAVQFGNEEDEKSALVIVPDYQLSLAIGKKGQNVRLAARLTGYKIDIRPESEVEFVDENTAEANQENAEAETEEIVDSVADGIDEDISSEAVDQDDVEIEDSADSGEEADQE